MHIDRVQIASNTAYRCLRKPHTLEDATSMLQAMTVTTS